MPGKLLYRPSEDLLKKVKNKLEKWRVIFSNRALKDWQLVSESKYREKVIQLLNLIEKDHFRNRLSQETSRHMKVPIQEGSIINRLVYRVDKDKHIANIIMMKRL